MNEKSSCNYNPLLLFPVMCASHFTPSCRRRTRRSGGADVCLPALRSGGRVRTAEPSPPSAVPLPRRLHGRRQHLRAGRHRLPTEAAHVRRERAVPVRRPDQDVRMQVRIVPLTSTLCLDKLIRPIKPQPSAVCETNQHYTNTS